MHKKTYILLLISFALLVSLSGVIWYALSSVVTLKDEENILRGELQSWVKRSKQTSSLQNTLIEARRVKLAMDDYFFVPTEENQIALISDLERVIKETGSAGEVKSLDVNADYSKVVGSITVSGEWNNVYHTLLALEAYPIKLNLDDISILEEKSGVAETKNGVAPNKKLNYRANIKFTITNTRKPK